MNAKIYQLAILSLTVQIMLVMIHCKGYAHPKPDEMSETEHVAMHHGELEAYERLDALIKRLEALEDRVEKLENSIKPRRIG